jgi:hypothetical protein
MPRLFPRILLKWQEPRLVRRHIDEYEAKKRHPFFKYFALVFYFVLLMVVWWLNTLKPNSKAVTFPVACVLTLGLAVFCVYIVPLIYRIAQSKILISENSIRWIRANAWRDWKYKEIEGYTIDSVTINDKSFPVLVLIIKKGKTSMLGIDPSVSLDKLDKILSENVLRKNQREIPSDSDNLKLRTFDLP